ncbi:MAG: tRNA (adenosine(37)-N6)-threonylcarbamoyltransferase complex ATPase subunit type 1 TsaE [Clostridia bacterium]|nr:tRNA (adenosine(37)-N6)-threonylcarbamoyltransferase complex ATPase subunit type 1 TsaE [Clostridia bacterium]
MGKNVVTNEADSMTSENLGTISYKKDGKMLKKKKLMFKITPSTITKTAMLTAISFVLYAFGKFNLPMLFPNFLEIQFSELPALLAGFSMGPLSGSIVIVVKCLLKLPMSSTAFVGELTDIIIGLCFVLPSSLIYKYNKNRKGALLGLFCGMILTTVAAVLINRFISIPIYIELFFHGNWNILLGMVSPLYPNVTISNFYAYYLGLAIVPFNLLRCLITVLLTFLVYKRISTALHWEFKSLKRAVNSTLDDNDVHMKTTENGMNKTAGENELTNSNESKSELENSVENVGENSSKSELANLNVIKNKAVSFKESVVTSSIENINNDNTKEFNSKSLEDTQCFAKKIANELKGGEIILLDGELGAGKTTFTKGLALALGVEEEVTSPTFTILNVYDSGRIPLFHMDMYRIESEDELYETGVEDYLSKAGVTVIEWNKLKNLSGKIYKIAITSTGENERKFAFQIVESSN